ncbi:MAG: lysophospholipid acyltransferase family protein [Akkermansia sp.]
MYWGIFGNMPEGERNKMVDIRDLVGEGIHMPAIVASSAEKMLGLARLNKAYSKILEAVKNGTTENFFNLSTKFLGLKYQLRPGDLDHIPKKGACVVVANHPHGLSDGLMFGDLLTRVRDDVRILANEQLSLCGELEPWLIKVDVYEDDNACRKNFNGIKQMLSWLSKGGLIGIFPAGTAASYSIKDKHVTDDEWNENIASIIRRTKATVVPVHFPGRNSLLFQGISLINRDFRVAFLPREVGRDSRKVHKIVVGKPVSVSTLSQFESDEALMSQLRLRTYLLGKSYEKSRKPFVTKIHVKKSRQEELIAPIPGIELQEEINALPHECTYVQPEGIDWTVYIAESWQIPKLLREIGRLRELTFRSVGEGSGLSCDLDEFDNHYLHLFLWDRAEQKLIGAYRMGRTDQILKEFGVKGLYNGAYFSFSPTALEAMSRGLEMGRAFIVPEYQKRPLALGTIWQGIGHYMARYPQYRYLYGTVSISRDYTNLSRAIIVSYLEAKEMEGKLASSVRAFTPPHRLKLKASELRILPIGLTDSQGLSQLISEIEEDGKGIPVLLRQYLRLNGKILSFSVDKNFGDVLDCLIFVDMYKSPERSFKRYLGKDTYEELLPYIQAAKAEK